MYRSVTVLVLSAVQVTISPPSANGQSDSLLVSYLFSGNAADSSGNGFDGAVSGAVLTQDRFGNPDAAYFFDGVDDYIGMPALWSAGSNQLTAGAWFSAVAAPTEGKVVYHGFDGEFQLLVDRNYVSGAVHLASAWQWVSDSLENPSVWHSAVVTWEQGQYLKLYVDGALADSVGVPDEPLLNVGSGFPSSVGSYSRTRGAYFSGSVDDVLVYGRALNKEEINALYFWSPVGVDEGNGDTPVAGIVNHPNPFATSTTIDIEFSIPGAVDAHVYNVLGQRVATLVDGETVFGKRSLVFDGTNLPNGLYFFVVRAGDLFRTKALTKLE